MIRFVGIGDLVVDLYYKNNKLIGINGGKTTSNIIANLAHLGYKTVMFGTVGNDEYGKIAINSLAKIGVDISNVTIKDLATRMFHIVINNQENITTKRCPICNDKKWYEDSQIDIYNTINNIKKQDVIIIDSINSINMNIINAVYKSNIIMLDMGYYNELELLSKEEIYNILNNKFNIINMNERVALYLMNKLNFNDLNDLYNFINPKLLIITKGKLGALFIHNNKIINKDLNIVGKEVDANGAGDAFFATIISEYINNNLIISEEIIEQAFIKANNITKEVVSNIGARGHINELYKVKKIKNICCCKNIRY